MLLAQAKLIQFPLRVAFAATAHKLQGQTVSKPMSLVVDMRSAREPSQAYVMLSRIQELNQLFIIEELPVTKLKPSDIAMKEVARLDTVSLNNNRPKWFTEKQDHLNVSYLNTQSLNKHFLDMQGDATLQLSDIICVAETWRTDVTDDDPAYSLEGYSCHFVHIGRGKGLATYFRESFSHVTDVAKPHYQISKFETDHVEIISVYRSQSACVEDLVQDIKTITDKDKITVVLGDFNICYIR